MYLDANSLLLNVNEKGEFDLASRERVAAAKAAASGGSPGSLQPRNSTGHLKPADIVEKQGECVPGVVTPGCPA